MRRVFFPAVLAAAFTVLPYAPAGAQAPTMPSTLRYGSGLLDIPVSSVLPHLQVRGTLSSFFVGLERRVEVDADGNEAGFSDGFEDLSVDGALAVGLYDRFEAGLTLQSFGGDAKGGDVWGLFGRVRIWEPVDQGLGLAAGARYVTSPDWGDGIRYVPGRLGFPDRRLARAYTGGTNLTVYGVATAYLRGFDGGPVPENDVTFTLGYGSGMFHAGGRLDLYADGHANGWFYGTSLHVRTGAESILTLMAEHNGFDVNVGAQLDWSGLRVGVHWLASNHAPPPGGHVSEYTKPKLGLLASVAVCPRERGLRCRSRMMTRVEPDTIVLPAPPPDTVIVDAPPVPAGTETQLCLSTGQNVRIRVTEAGDTLVGPRYVPLASLGPGIAFAGAYAGGAFWYENGQPITFEGFVFGRAPETFPVDCDEIVRVGVHQGVPVFADIAAERPLVMLFVPVRPGVWRRYERGRP